MISPALSQLLDRARMRYGVDVEVLDAVLESLYPEGGSELRRLIDYSPIARRALLHAMAHGSAEHFDVDGTSYRLYPLRKSLERKQVSGLLAVRAGTAQAAHAAEADPWSDFARAAVEAELASAERLGDARQYSRRLAGAFRFAEFMSETSDEST